MLRMIRGALGAALVGGALVLAACSSGDDGAADTSAAQTTPAAGATTAAVPTTGTTTGLTTGAMAGATTGASASAADAPMRLEVDVAARRLYVLRNGQPADTHRVAVGSEKWPTQPGQWTVTQVVWNPEWVPPDESWAEEREPRKSGDPKNPLGRVQLVYDPPRSIHGTNQPSSIGKAVSHGSIRMTNADLTELAKQVMEAGGAAKDDAWVKQAQANRTEKQIVQLPRPVPIRVY
jgi:lipoprotein-anchoring transpeptidase ErfK/SrfK